MSMAEGIAIFSLLFGLFFSLVGVVGMIRFPDVYTRIHASGKVGTLGIFGFLIAAAALMPASTFKVITLGLFILVSGPVASHAIAAAVHRTARLNQDGTVNQSDLNGHADDLLEQSPQNSV